MTSSNPSGPSCVTAKRRSLGVDSVGSDQSDPVGTSARKPLASLVKLSKRVAGGSSGGAVVPSVVVGSVVVVGSDVVLASVVVVGSFESSPCVSSTAAAT